LKDAQDPAGPEGLQAAVNQELSRALGADGLLGGQQLI